MRKKDRHLYQEVEEVGKPRPERPKGSHESHLEIVGAADLGEDLLDKAERREGISLQIIPRLDQRIYRRRLRVCHRGKIDLKAMVDGGGE